MRSPLKLIVDHLPRIGRRRSAAIVEPTPSVPAADPRTSYWANDCATHPWRAGCRSYDL